MTFYASGRRKRMDDKDISYERYAVELMGEILYYFNKTVMATLAGKENDQTPKGHLVIRLYQMISALEHRPYDSRILDHARSLNASPNPRASGPAIIQ